MTALIRSPRRISSLGSFSRRGKATSVRLTSRMMTLPFDPADDAGDDLADPRGELVDDLFLLRVADLLEDDLLGRLGGDAAQGVGGEVDLDRLALLDVGADGPGLGQGDLFGRVLGRLSRPS